jgi:hypothetical protein
MADNKIKVIIDVVADKASTSLRSFKTDLANTEGALGKMKVTGSAAFETIKGNAANFAMAAGAALVGFAAKAVGEFQKLALEAGKFADATGLAVEDASRWIEVAGDVGVGADQIQAAILKMNREIANGGLDQFANDVVRAKDGTVDASATFENLVTKIGAIKDPTDRAAAAQKAFGKGFASIAELMEMDAVQLRAALEGVSDAKIIDKSELDKAREFRDAMDNLRDKTEDLALTLGESLVPVLTDVAEVAADLGDVLGAELPGGIKLIDAMVEPFASKFRDLAAAIQLAKGEVLDLSGPAAIVAERLRQDALAAEAAEIASEGFGEATEVAAEATRSMAEAVQGSVDRLREQAEVLEEQANAQRAAADAGFALRDAEADLAEKVAGANDEMKEADGDLHKVRAVLDDVAESAGAVADNTVRVWEEQAKANGVTLTAVQKQDLWNDSMMQNASTLEGPMRDAVLDYVAQVNGIPPEKMSEIKALIDEGKIDEANTALDEASKARDALITAQASTAAAEEALRLLTRTRNMRINVQQSSRTGGGPGYSEDDQFASGGPIPGAPGQPVPIVAHGGEFMLSKNVVDAIKLGRPTSGLNGGGGSSGGSTSNTYSITVNVAPGGDPASTGRALVEAIQDYERVNSSRWRAS